MAAEEANRGTKRELDGAGGTTQENFKIKLLVPQHLASSVIGKGGSVIKDLQARTSTNIKMSETRAFFPGSTNRVCMCDGKPDNVKTVVPEVISIIWQHFQAINVDSDNPKTELPLGVSIPQAACGAVIGRGGEVMKGIQTSSGCRIHMARKNEMTYPSERPCVITGQGQEITMAVMTMIDLLVAEGDLAKYQNPSTRYVPSNSQEGAHGAAGGMGTNGTGMGAGAFGQPAYAMGGPMGYDQSGMMAAYGGTPAGFGMPGQTGFYEMAPGAGNFPGAGAGTFPGAGAGTFPGAGAGTFPGAGAGTFPGAGAGTFPGVVTADAGGPEVTVTMEIPDELVGAVLGRGGMTLMHIKGSSGASIRVSQKGDYAPGSTNRYATIKGTAKATQDAQLRILQQMQVGKAATDGSGEEVVITVEVPDEHVGAILGGGGAVMQNIRATSGAFIKLSQRGEHAPGSINRFATIKGTVKATQDAQLMIQQRMQANMQALQVKALSGQTK